MTCVDIWPNNSKTVDLGEQNTLKFDFSDKIYVGDHSKQGLKVKKLVLGRERGG